MERANRWGKKSDIRSRWSGRSVCIYLRFLCYLLLEKFQHGWLIGSIRLGCLSSRCLHRGYKEDGPGVLNRRERRKRRFCLDPRSIGRGYIFPGDGRAGSPSPPSVTVFRTPRRCVPTLITSIKLYTDYRLPLHCHSPYTTTGAPPYGAPACHYE